MSSKKGKNAAVVSYITLFGTIIGFFLNFDERDEFAYFHIRQSLGLHITFYFILAFISDIDSVMISGSFYLSFFMLWLYGFLMALNNKQQTIPLVGNLFQKLFKPIIGANN